MCPTALGNDLHALLIYINWAVWSWQWDQHKIHSNNTFKNEQLPLHPLH